MLNTLSKGQKDSYLYALKMEISLGKNLRIELSISENELGCKVLKHDDCNVLVG